MHGETNNLSNLIILISILFVTKGIYMINLGSILKEKSVKEGKKLFKSAFSKYKRCVYVCSWQFLLTVLD